MTTHNFCPYCMNPVTPGKACKVCGLNAGNYTPLAHHLPPGTVLKGRYLIGRVLGEGGFGITYIGCDLQLEVKLAIKEYFPINKVSRNASTDLTVSRYAGTTSEEFEHDLERYLREARTMAKLSKQQTIVTVHDFFRDNDTAYIVMEYIDGTTFKELCARCGGRIPARELLILIEPLFPALQAMHDAGLIHRDISPDNLMLEDGNVRLLDFGCARDVTGDQTLTISLKHSYAPVEQYQGKGQGPWTDIYALGATIYYCLTGSKPPRAMDRVMGDELVAPRSLGADLTAGQEKALLTAMRVRPRQRYQSMREFHAALYEDVEQMPKTNTNTAAIFGTAAAGAAIIGTAAAAGRRARSSAHSTAAGTDTAGTPDAAFSTGTGTAATSGAALLTGTGTSAMPGTDISGAAKARAAAAEVLLSADKDGGEETSAQSGGSSEKKNFALTWLRQNKRLAGIGAAVIALVLIVGIAIAVISGSGNGTKEKTAQEDTTEEIPAESTEDTAETAETAETDEDVSEESTDADGVTTVTTDAGTTYQIRDGVAYITENEEDSLLDALTNDAVESVIVRDDGVTMTQLLEVYKPLTIESGGIYAASSVIIGEGGSITDDGGGLCICGLLRTMDGGSLTVTANGDVSDEQGTLLLESWDDLAVEDGGSFSIQGCSYGEDELTEKGSAGSYWFHVVDEEALFADAVSVESAQDLVDAMGDDSVSAIIISADLSIEELGEALVQTKPVLIAEGVTVTALDVDQELDEDGNIVTVSGDERDDPSAGWIVSESVLINHGTLLGHLAIDDLDERGWVINDGSINVSKGGGECGTHINLPGGTINLMSGRLEAGYFVNLGTFTHIPQSGSDSADLEIKSAFYNSGTFLVQGIEEEDLRSSVSLVKGAYSKLRNSPTGVVEIGNYGELINYEELDTQGSVLVSSGSGRMENYGLILMGDVVDGECSLSVSAAEHYANYGVIMMHLSDADNYDCSDDENVIYRNDYADDAVGVSTAQELEEALNNEDVLCIRLDSSITWEGDLTISGKYVTGCGLTVSGGTLTVENGGLGLQGGDLTLENGSSLTVSSLGKVYANNFAISEDGTVTVDASSAVVFSEAQGENGLTDIQIDLNTLESESGDAYFITLGGLNLTDCIVTLGAQNSYLLAESIEEHGSTIIYQNEGTVTEWSELSPYD